MRRLLIPLFAVFALLGVIAAHAETPTPAPNLSLAKDCSLSGDIVTCTVTVTNSGFVGAEGVTVTDDLPEDVLWDLLDRDEGCYWARKTVFDQVVRCEAYVEPRHLNDAKTDFVNGSLSFTVVGLMPSGCGRTVENRALLVWGNTTLSAYGYVVSAPCPTPTPIPPTPTAVPPTATAVPPTATVVPPTATVTAPPVSVATPLPPKTGTGHETDDGPGLPLAVLLVYGLTFGAFAFVATYCLVRRR